MSTDFLAMILFEPEPSEQEKAMWDRFVAEYVKDFNPYLACLRIGFADSFALEHGRLIMQKPYVQQKIADHKNAVETPANQLEKDKALIAATFREMAQNGNGQTRVSAAMGLARLHGLDQAADADAGKLEKIVDAMKEIAKIVPA